MALWAKVDVDMPTDAKLLGQPVATRHLWTCLICLAKRQDEEGSIRGYDCALLSGAFNVPRKAVATALTYFQAARMVELDPDGTIRLLNFIERQGVTSVAEQRDQWRQRQEKRRSVTRDSPVTQSDVTPICHASRTEEEEEKRQEEKVLVASKLAPGSAFQAFVLKEWPDIRNPAELERRGIDAYPMLNLLAEAKKAKGWEVANPRRAKKKHGTFFWGWLGKAKRFLELNQPDAVETERASARASRDAAKTLADIRKIESVVPEAPSPEVQAKLKALMKGIGT